MTNTQGPSNQSQSRPTDSGAAAERGITAPVRLFLDDERTAPKGWALLRTTDEFVAALDNVDPTRVEAISIDWHLGRDIPNGNLALSALLDRLKSNPDRFSALERLHFHSSDAEEARAMMLRACEVLRAHPTLQIVGVELSLPWDEDD